MSGEVGEWYRVLGAGGRKHFATDRTTGVAGTYLGFACGRTFSLDELSLASTGLACATCRRAVAAATKPAPPAAAMAGVR